MLRRVLKTKRNLNMIQKQRRKSFHIKGILGTFSLAFLEEVEEEKSLLVID